MQLNGTGEWNPQSDKQNKSRVNNKGNDLKIATTTALKFFTNSFKVNKRGQGSEAQWAPDFDRFSGARRRIRFQLKAQIRRKVANKRKNYE